MAWVLVLSPHAGAEAIQLLGVSVVMEEKEIVEKLSARGYECAKQSNFVCEELGSCQFTCESGEKVVTLNEDQLIFNCNNFDSCSLSLRELAQEIIDQEIVQALDFNRARHPSPFLSDNVIVEEYCGRGPGGDILCVKESKNVRNGYSLGVQVELLRGGYGKGNPSFK